MTGSLPSNAASRRLTDLRDRLGAGFDQDATVTTPGIPVPNGAGGFIPGSGDPTVQTVRCQVRFPRSRSTDPAEPTQTTLERVEVRLPLGASVSVKSRIVVGKAAYEVQGHDVGRSYASEIVCDCLRVDDGQLEANP